MKLNHNRVAKKRITNTLWTVLLIVFAVASPAQGKLVSSAVEQNDETARVAAERVLKQARDATRKDLKSPEIKGLIVNSRTEVSDPYPEAILKARPQYRNQRAQGTVDEELAVSLPDKIREKIDSSYPTNQWVADRTLNGDRFVQKSDTLVNGKAINFTVNRSSPKSEKEQIAEYKDSVFLAVFPIILDYSWHSAMEFRYIGVAEAGGTKAEVIETMLSNGVKYRFFFDQQTHLMMMTIETRMSKSTNKEIERKYFFSDYRKEDGLLVAHRIVTETNKEVTDERELKRLQINPTFKPDYFEVKGK